MVQISTWFYPLSWSSRSPLHSGVAVQGSRGTCAPTHACESDTPTVLGRNGRFRGPWEALCSIFLHLALSRPNSRLGTCVLSSSQFSNGSHHQNSLMVALSAGLGSWQVISIPYMCWGILIRWLQRFVSASPPAINLQFGKRISFCWFCPTVYYAGFLRHLCLARWFLRKGMVPIVVNPVKCLMNN